MFPKRRSSSHELDLQRQNATLALKLLKANAALRLKTVYCERLEILLHQRLETIDALNGKLEQARAANHRLDQECERLVEMVRLSPDPF